VHWKSVSWLACDFVERANVCVCEEILGRRGWGAVWQGLWATYRHLGGMTLKLQGFRGNWL